MNWQTCRAVGGNGSLIILNCVLRAFWALEACLAPQLGAFLARDLSVPVPFQTVVLLAEMEACVPAAFSSVVFAFR